MVLYAHCRSKSPYWVLHSFASSMSVNREAHRSYTHIWVRMPNILQQVYTGTSLRSIINLNVWFIIIPLLN